MAGVIDEVAIFDTALSLKEIQTILESPNGLKGTVLAVGSPQSKLTRHLGTIERPVVLLTRCLVHRLDR